MASLKLFEALVIFQVIDMTTATSTTLDWQCSYFNGDGNCDDDHNIPLCKYDEG